jgi:hypothetical protein
VYSANEMKTTSELAFESFLKENNLTFEKIEEETTRRPDYRVQTGDIKLMFEIKELTEDEDFAGGNRTIGDHVRRMINKARGQVRYAAAQGIPAVLLIYNSLDPLFSFGTEDHDFTTAMYGEYTLLFDRSTGAPVDAFHGRNQSLREEWNTEFSAIGRLKQDSGKMTVTLFDNAFSQVKIPYEKLPACFDVIRVNISA